MHSNSKLLNFERKQKQDDKKHIYRKCLAMIFWSAIYFGALFVYGARMTTGNVVGNFFTSRFCFIPQKSKKINNAVSKTKYKTPATVKKKEKKPK